VEIVAILFMLGAGGALALFVMAAYAIQRREAEGPGSREAMPSQERERIAASLLFHVVRSGGGADEDALRTVRRGSGIAAPVTRGIDVANWAESFARLTDTQQRLSLLETAVQLVATRDRPIPLRQYAALLDLSFGLGFQTDALARLRELYGFDYVDHAKDGRPRSADRSGGGAPLFVREPRDATALLAVLGLSGEATRRDITAAYRRLVAQHHPDRFHGRSVEEQSGAAQRFIEITRAYEELLAMHRD
jgi:DnaJ-domain-containing protein 1